MRFTLIALLVFYFFSQERYEKEQETLEDLLTKRDAMRKEALWNALTKSEHTYEEIISFIQSTKDLDY